MRYHAIPHTIPTYAMHLAICPECKKLVGWSKKTGNGSPAGSEKYPGITEPITVQVCECPRRCMCEEAS